MFSLRNVLKEKFANNPHIKNILVACGVVFPDIRFQPSSQEIIPEIVYNMATNHITDYMERVFDYWQGRQHREPEKLSPSDIQKIVSFLRGEFVFVPSLGSRLENVERHLVRLTSEQVHIMEWKMSGRRFFQNTFVEQEPGPGCYCILSVQKISGMKGDFNGI